MSTIRNLLFSAPVLGASLACALSSLAGDPLLNPPPVNPSPITIPAAPTQEPILSAPQIIGEPVTVPATPLESGKGVSCGIDFSKLPPTRIAPRLGNFTNPPTGEGYYSFLDVLSGNFRKGPPKSAYPAFGLMPPSFFDADFRYLDDPKNEQHDQFDSLKRIRLGDQWMFSTGGSAWSRFHYEDNSRLTNVDNSYNLFRVRSYADLWYRDQFRLYAEFLSAHSVGHDLPPLPIDVNKADLLNLFIDWKLFDFDSHPAYVRIGRQELLFGSQRLISTLDWANTRRTFQGVRAFRQGEKFDVDLFWVQPVIANPNRFDSVDNNQNFAGAWGTYRPEKGHFLDFYYLFLDNTNRVRQQGIDRAPFSVHTLGARYTGDRNQFLWDAELAMQFGERGSENIVAGMGTVGGGYHFKNAPMNPTFWVYYDYASGDHSPNNGTYNTFNQLFPFGHYYLGWIDQVGRQNIHDVNAHLFLYPTKWVTLWAQYHRLMLDSRFDALYNAGGAATRRSANGSAGNNVGDEVDIVLNFHISAHSDLLLGYSKLFGGTFLERTAGAAGRSSADMFFLQYGVRW